jgi:hypothetical protein
VKETGFLQLRRGLWEHVRNGQMHYTAAIIYIYILSEADTRTGVWKGCAKSIAGILRMPLSTVKYGLSKLDGVYIRRFIVRGRRFCYPIICHKYVLTSGPDVGRMIDALSSTNDKGLAFFPEPISADISPDVVPDVGRQKRSENREERKTPRPSSAAAPTDSLEAETKQSAFDVFWERWPRNAAKSAALRAWVKIPIAEYPAIMAGLEKFLTCEQWMRGIIPHASTWLNGKRWQDEDIPQVPIGGSNGRKPSVSDNIETTLRTMRAAEQNRPN